MTNFQKYKHEARRAEQRSDWTRAIDLYQRALDADEDMADLSLYNRIGDLHLRLGQNDSAVECYERAVERYADHGMHTSAIALCNKVLRIAPGRTAIYRRLCGLHARTGLVAEARSNCLTYVRQVLEAGESSDAFEAVDEFAEQSGDEEIRLRFSEELAERDDREGAADQLRIVYRIRRKRGSDAADLRARIEELAPDGPPPESEAPAEAADGASTPLEAVDLASVVSARLAENGEAPAFEAHRPSAGAEAPQTADDGLAEVRRVLDRFRAQVRDVLENGDLSIRYDLGVEFMTIGLLDEAIEEFRAAVADPGLIEAANARIGECLALRTSGSTFEAIRRGTLAASAVKGPTFRVVPEATSAEEPVADTMEAADADAPAGDEGVDDAPAPDPAVEGEDELQGHFFRARLAQYRIRRAEERHGTDHAAHLDLGNAYIEMALHQEALRELSVALAGPKSVAGLAARALGRLATGRETDPELALDVLGLLSSSEIDRIAETVGTQLAAEWGEEHTHAARLAQIRGSLSYAVDDLPAMEDLFPAMTGAEADGEAEQPVPDESEPEPDEFEDLEALLAELDASDFESEPVAPDAESIPDEIPEAESDPVAESVERAADLAAEGRVDEATEVLRVSVARLEDLKRTREALRVLDRLLELAPDDVEAHQKHTELALMVNDRGLLMAAFQGLAACFERADLPKRARAAYGRMLDFDPSHAEAKEAMARIDQAELAREAEATQGRGEPALAETDLERDGRSEDDSGGEQESEDEARSHYELGLAFRQMGMWDEAARELSSALPGVSDRLAALEVLGECLVKAGRHGKAVSILGQNLRGDEDAEQVGALYFLGLALQGEGEDEAARDVFGRIEAASPGYRDAANRLSELSL